MTTEQMDAVDAMKGVGNINSTREPISASEALAALLRRQTELNHRIEAGQRQRETANQIIKDCRAELVIITRMIRASQPRGS